MRDVEAGSFGAAVARQRRDWTEGVRTEGRRRRQERDGIMAMIVVMTRKWIDVRPVVVAQQSTAVA